MSKAGLWDPMPDESVRSSPHGVPPLPIQPGEIIGGKYEVNRVIGVGGIGFVVSATHIELGEEVALKFLRPEAANNQELVARFAREARASAKIKSEYVARVLDVGSLAN